MAACRAPPAAASAAATSALRDPASPRSCSPPATPSPVGPAAALHATSVVPTADVPAADAALPLRSPPASGSDAGAPPGSDLPVLLLRLRRNAATNDIRSVA